MSVGVRTTRRRLAALALLAVLATAWSSAFSAAPAAAATAQIPKCPPDCGSAAAGDPTLIPYLAPNPGPGWLALPADDAQAYDDSLKRSLTHAGGKGVVFNAAAARWLWETGRYGLLTVLVSSSSLSRVKLDHPAADAQDLCALSRGEPQGHLVAIAGVPGSVSGLCTFAPGGTFHGATVVAFRRANVAVLMEIVTQTDNLIDQRTTTIAAQQQYRALPPDGVLVSSGSDVPFVVVWSCLIVVLVVCIASCIRRRGSWLGPYDAIADAFVRRRMALGVTVLAVVGTMAFSMVDARLLHGSSGWYESQFNDFWRAWASSAYMTFGGGYAHLYHLDTALETAPALEVVVAPIARLAFGLSFPNPNDVLYPSAYWVAGPLFLSALALPICAADRVLGYMAVADVRRRLTVLGVLAVTLPPAALFGHPEDLIALGAMLYGLLAALEGRERAVGWWLGVALAFQFLAFLAIPMALVLLTRPQWPKAVWRMVVVPVAVMAVPLVVAPSGTLGQLVHQKVYDDAGYISPTWHLDPGVAAFIRALVAIAAIPAAIALSRALPKSRRDAANLVVWTLAGLFALRVCEPELVPYFLAPSLALFTLSASRGPWWRLIMSAALAVWLNWWLHVVVNGRWSFWLLLVAQLCVLGWLAFPRRPLPPEPVPARHPEAVRPRASGGLGRVGSVEPLARARAGQARRPRASTGHRSTTRPRRATT